MTKEFDTHYISKLAQCLNQFNFEKTSFIGFQEKNFNCHLENLRSNEITRNESNETFEYSFESVGHAFHGINNLSPKLIRKSKNGDLILCLKGYHSGKNGVYLGLDTISFSPFPDEKTIQAINDEAYTFSSLDISINTNKNSYGPILFEIPCDEIFSNRKAKWLGTRNYKKSMVHTLLLTEKYELIDVSGEEILDFNLNNHEKLNYNASSFNWRKTLHSLDRYENLEIMLDAKELIITNFKIHFVMHTELSCIKKLQTNFECEYNVENDKKRKKTIKTFVQFLLESNIPLENLEKYFDTPTFEIVKAMAYEA